MTLFLYTHPCAYICVIKATIKFFFLADAYETAKLLCEQYYLVAPELEVEEFNGKRQSILDEIRQSQGGMAKKKYFHVKSIEGDWNADCIRAVFPRAPKMVQHFHL